MRHYDPRWMPISATSAGGRYDEFASAKWLVEKSVIDWKVLRRASSRFLFWGKVAVHTEAIYEVTNKNPLIEENHGHSRDLLEMYGLPPAGKVPGSSKLPTIRVGLKWLGLPQSVSGTAMTFRDDAGKQASIFANKNSSRKGKSLSHATIAEFTGLASKRLLLGLKGRFDRRGLGD